MGSFDNPLSLREPLTLYKARAEAVNKNACNVLSFSREQRLDSNCVVDEQEDMKQNE